LGGRSIIGIAAEPEVGYTPYGVSAPVLPSNTNHDIESSMQYHWMMHCGMEVFLLNRELIRTGMGALPNPDVPKDGSVPLHDQAGNKCWQLFNYSFGLDSDGIFTQSSLGIIVKTGIWLMPRVGIKRT